MRQSTFSATRLRTIAILLIALAFATGAVIASPTAVNNGCMEDLYNEYGQGGTLNCTANDIQIAGVTNVTITDDGCAFAGDTVTFDATFEVKLTAQTRHDVGLYLAQDGGDALSGSCLIDTLPFEPNNEDCTGSLAPYTCCTGIGTGTCDFLDEDNLGDDTTNSNDFGYCSPDGGTTVASPAKPCAQDTDCAVGQTCEEFSGLQDLCGDVVDNMDPRNPVFHSITGVTVTCTDTNSNGLLDVAACTSWRQPGNNELCLTPMAAFPGAPSKCRCDEALEIPIPVPQIIEVVKDLTPSGDPGRFNLLVDGVVEATDAADGGSTGPVSVTSSVCTSGGCLCSVSGTTCENDAECSGSVCTESLANNGQPLSCTADTDCNRTGVCEVTQQGNSPKTCMDVSDCGPGDRCLMSLSDVCQVDSCRDFTHAVGETAGTSTDLGLYEKSISCVDQVGRCTLDPSIHCVTDTICDSASSGDTCDLTPTEVASCTDCTSADLTLIGSANIVCTITNVLIDPCAGVDCSGLDDACNTGVCVSGVCQAEPKPDSTPCNDGNACTTSDTCDAGSCEGGAPPACDDGNICTDDSCDPATGCVATNNTDPCNDGNACTTNDTCDAGSCEGGAPPVCDDGNICTDDSCDPATGCVATNNTDPCNDGSACTTNDTCDAGSCEGGAPPVCDDGNICTDDSCDPATGCVATNNTDPCNDGNACTTSDTCDAGSCQGGAPPVCDDGNICTDDSCDPATGCVATNNTDPCNDGNACTTSDTCDAGSCQGGAPPVCDDGNICTDDSCDPATGCVATNNTDPCNDGNACTTSDTCDAGSCQGGAPPVCDDGNICTDDSCDPATGCVTTNNTDPCNDGAVCTSAAGTPQTPDQCVDGVCTGIPVDCSGADNQCNVGACDSTSGACFADPVVNSTPCDDDSFCTSETGVPGTPDYCLNGVCTGDPVDCSDDTSCTVDSCDETNNTCISEPRDSLCDDDLHCNGYETCDPTAGCVDGTAVTCDDQDSCTVDTCDDDLDECVFTLDGSACAGIGSCTVLRLALNQNIFVSDETLILWLSVFPGPDPVDLYFQWVTPDGLVLFITSDGSLMSTPEPYYRGWMPEELDTEEIFRIIFTDEPEGEYSIRGVATVPGTALRAATSNEVSFTIVVGESDE